MNAQSERLKVLQSVVDKQYLVEQRSGNNPNKQGSSYQSGGCCRREVVKTWHSIKKRC
jgi:hypothetical protein